MDILDCVHYEEIDRHHLYTEYKLNVSDAYCLNRATKLWIPLDNVYYCQGVERRNTHNEVRIPTKQNKLEQVNTFSLKLRWGKNINYFRVLKHAKFNE